MKPAKPDFCVFSQHSCLRWFHHVTVHIIFDNWYTIINILTTSRAANGGRVVKYFLCHWLVPAPCLLRPGVTWGQYDNLIIMPALALHHHHGQSGLSLQLLIVSVATATESDLPHFYHMKPASTDGSFLSCPEVEFMVNYRHKQDICYRCNYINFSNQRYF